MGLQFRSAYLIVWTALFLGAESSQSAGIAPLYRGAVILKEVTGIGLIGYEIAQWVGDGMSDKEALAIFVAGKDIGAVSILEEARLLTGRPLPEDLRARRDNLLAFTASNFDVLDISIDPHKVTFFPGSHGVPLPYPIFLAVEGHYRVTPRRLCGGTPTASSVLKYSGTGASV